MNVVKAIAVRLLPVTVCVLGLLLVEATSRTGMPAAARAAVRAPATDARPRLVVFWLDGLSRRDVENGKALPRLTARLSRALHGPVRCCADAISVPCLTAMVTGRDTFSLFGMMRNFGAGAGLPPGNLLDAFAGAGLRRGYIGEPLIGAALTGFEWRAIRNETDDLGGIAEGMRALDRERLDMLVVQLNGPDEIAHAHGDASSMRTAALESIDEAVDHAIADLRPLDHVAFLGDHGHTPDGRHFSGLDLPTYAVFLGKTFSRPLHHSMTVADYGSLWTRVFGMRFAESDWVTRYFERGRLEPVVDLPEIPSGRSPLPVWVLALLLAAAGAILAAPFLRSGWPGAGHPRALAASGLLLLGACFAVGFRYDAAWRFLFYGSRVFYTAIGLVTALTGLVALAPVISRFRLRDDPRASNLVLALLACGGVLLAMPTIYKFGGTYAATLALLVALAFHTLRARTLSRLAWTSAFVAVLLTIWNPAVRNFAVRWFPFYSETLGRASPWAALVFACLAAALADGPRRATWLAACGCGLGLGILAPWLPAGIYAAPAAFAVPLLVAAHRWPRLQPFSAGMALMGLPFLFGYEGQAFSVDKLAPVAASILLWPLWMRARTDASRLERAAAFLVLAWLGLWTSMGCRINGISFQYFFRWVSAGPAIEQTWWLNTALTFFKYMAVPLLGLLLAKRMSPDAVSSALPSARGLVGVKLGLLLAFVAGFAFSSAAAHAPPFLYADALEELLVWALMSLLFLGFADPGPDRSAPPLETIER
ncbi:MAG: alkaline phosphatase family protein [Deltaproteobacteria bacterium]|nr:alkaline phosphatase family protein [Deltaproteobacteria bacterium]